MQIEYLLYSFDLLELLGEFIVVWLKYLDHEVVHIVLAKMMHSVSEVVGRQVVLVEVELLGLLMEHPGVGQVAFDVFAKDEVSEDELVFCD